MSNPTICTIEGCQLLRKWNGLCSTHYRRKNGIKSAYIKKEEIPQSQTKCSFEDCERFCSAKNLCMTHYVQMKRNGVLKPIGFYEGKKKYLGKVVSYNSYGYPSIQINKKNKAIHRFVMEQKLGRLLLPGENVHHINGVRDDNRPENLELWLVKQPRGQRVEDLVAWAQEILDLYGNK